MNKYKIGDTIWTANAGQYATQIECPDCAGSCRIRMILANDEQVSIQCGGCMRGFEGSYGTITEYKFKAKVEEKIIDGIEIKPDHKGQLKTTYQINHTGSSWNSIDEEVTFATKEEAEERCKILIKDAVDAERDRLLKKHKDTKTWAWNASYHRETIRRLERDLVYHRACLNVADAKKKVEIKI